MFRNPTTDLIVVLVIVLLIFGPKRLPGLGKQLGQGFREFKDSITGDSKDDEDEERPAISPSSAVPAQPTSPQPAPPQPAPPQAAPSEPAPPQAAPSEPAGSQPAADSSPPGRPEHQPVSAQHAASGSEGSSAEPRP
jgi:sec-independent protein translocase protein TatA